MAAVAAPEFVAIENLYCGSVFPNQDTFAECETALCLFSAEWHGMQDVYWLARQGIATHCVDLNGTKLQQMADVYPNEFSFTVCDVFEFADYALDDGQSWDVVTLDPWTGLFERCANMLWVWTSLARKVVVLGHGNYRLPEPEAPDGWRLEQKIKRSDFKGGVYWLVFAHD
jgi:hypothetical protein